MSDQGVQELHPITKQALALLGASTGPVLTAQALELLQASLDALHSDPSLEHAMQSLVSLAAQLDEGGALQMGEQLLILASSACDALIAQKKAAWEAKASEDRQKAAAFAQFRDEVKLAPKKAEPVRMTDQRRALLDRTRIDTAQLDAARAGVRVGTRQKNAK